MLPVGCAAGRRSAQRQRGCRALACVSCHAAQPLLPPACPPRRQITDYDPKSRKHSVRYRDGDTQELHLRNEAVRYLEREAAAPAQRPKAADARRGGGGGGGGGDKRRAGGGAPPLPGKKAGRGTKRAREGSAGAGAEVSSGNERGGSVARRSKSQRGGGGTPVAAPPTASPPKDAVAGSGEASGVMTGDSEEGGGGGGSQGDPTLSGDAPYSSGGSPAAPLVARPRRGQQ
jgi:hypothetical protein